MPLSLLITRVSTFLATLLNVSLLPIILFRSPKYIGVYRYFLCAYVCSAAVYSICHYLCVTVFHSSPGVFLLYCADDRFPRRINTGLLVMVCICYASNLLIICCSFIYRFCILCRKDWLVFFQQGWRLCSWLFIVILILVIAALSIILTSPDLYLDNMLQDVLSSLKNQTNLREIAYIAYPAHNEDGSIFWHGAIPMIVFSGTAFLCAIIELICIYNMMRVFKRAQNSYFVNMERRLFYVLILQTILPILFNGIPIMISDATAFLHLPNPILLEYLGSVITLAQVIDPILIVLLVTEYRKTMSKLFKIRVSVHVLPTDTSNGHSHNHFSLNGHHF